jgi:energy-dependent translational throttle protein EttA
VAQPLGEFAELAGRAPMRCGGQPQMGDRIAFETVGAALQEQELRLESRQVLDHLRPNFGKRAVACARRQRQIKLGAHRRSAPAFVRSAGARIQIASVLVNVGNDHGGVIFEGVVHPIAVVGIDIYVGDALKARAPAQELDRDPAIVENAEAGCVITGRVVQTCDRHKCPAAAAPHDCIDGIHRSANHIGGSFVNPTERRSIPCVQKALAARRALANKIYVCGRVEAQEFLGVSRTRLDELHARVKSAPLELAHKGRIAVPPERVAAAKAVAREALPQHDCHSCVHDDSSRIRQSLAHAACAAIAKAARLDHNARLFFTLHASFCVAQYIFTMNRVSKVVPPKRVILRDISLSFFPGAKIGVLGLNGSGKSTLLRIMAGIDASFDGEARPQSGIRVGFLPQEPELDASKDVRTSVMEGVGDVFGLVERFNAVSDRFAQPMSDEEMQALLEEQAKLQDAIDATGGWELERKLEIAADALRLPPWETKIATLSGGEKRRVALCRLLLSAPDMLLLDEPTNHLDAESIAWLERYLEEYPSTVIAVTHDRYFLDNVAEWILELDRGHGIPWQGNYSSWLEQKERRLALEERENQTLRKTLERELEWVRQNPKARQAKSKARLLRYEELASKEFQERNETNEIYIPPGQRLGDLVIEVKNLRKAYGERLLIDDASFNLPRGGIVGIIGPNGAGKTTLFRMLTGVEAPDAGQIRVGPTVKLAYVDQSRQSLDAKKTVWEEISGGLDMVKVGNYETPSRGYVGRFNFKGAQQQQHIGELSGGERNRVHLAKVVKSGGNVLLLDEPTNDLDIETLRALEEALLSFPGCAVVISHDRWFLDRIATHILAFENNSEVVWFEGNYQQYVEDFKRRKGEEAAHPHRVRYRPLERK